MINWNEMTEAEQIDFAMREIDSNFRDESPADYVAAHSKMKLYGMVVRNCMENEGPEIDPWTFDRAYEQGWWYAA